MPDRGPGTQGVRRVPRGRWFTSHFFRFVLTHPENARARSRALLRIVAWALFRRFGRRPRTIDWVGGLRLRWYPDSIAIGNAWLCGLLEWPDMRFVMDCLRPGDLFVDVGANVGVYTLLATLSPDVDVVAFEPGQVARMRLMEHLELNDVSGRVEVLPFALSDRSGEGDFTVGRDTLNHLVAVGADQTETETETVPLRRLDDLLSGSVTGRSIVLKVDAEGHDARVLAGARRILEETRPPLIVEFNDARVRELLEPLGYRTFAYEPETRGLRPTGWRKSGTSNVLAIADVAAVEERLGRV